MKRRKALRQIGLGVSTGLFLPTWLSSCSDDPVGPALSYDGVVAIIGAGAAGLYAADILLSQGIDVIVFEASDRIGGRIHSIRQFEDYPVKTDFPLELGADRVFGSTSKWAEVVRESHTPVTEFRSSTTDSYILDGILVDNATSDADIIAAKNFLDSLSTYSGGDVTVSQAISNAGLSSRVSAVLNGWIGNHMGTSNDRLGIKPLAEALAVAARDGIDLTLTSNPMEDVLTSRFANVTSKVRLSTPVASIDYSGEGAIITDKNGETTRADKVIVTVPLSILKGNEIQFTPTLPSAKTAAYSKFGMDACIRLIIDFKQSIWGSNKAFIFGGTQSPEYFNCGISRTIANSTLSLTINGPKAEELSALGDDIVPAILSELDAATGNLATPNVRRDFDTDAMLYILKDWSKEPYIQGYGSYPKTGATLQDRESLASGVADKLYFAGEATDVNGEAGTVSGALLSAKRAAEALIESIVTG